MEKKELMQELETLAKNLEGKTSTEIKDALEAFETKNSEVMELAVKAVKDELTEKMEAIQEHADKLDIKLQEKAKKELAKGDAVKQAITENFDNIKSVKKGQSVQVKAVGDMTLANHTGDEPRDYNFDVVMFPNQKVNVADLAGQVNIEGGTYTFTREGAGEGSISTQTEGSSKSQRDYDFTTVDISTDFLAGFARYSKKMRNNLPYLSSFIPTALRRDYWKAENSAFYTVIAAAATASTELAASHDNYAEQLIAEVATLDASDYEPNAIVLNSADYHTILKTEKSTGAGYGLPFGFTYDNGVMRCLGIPVVKANWVAANKYLVGDWSRVNKVVTEGLSLDFSEEEGTNFVTNNITARIEAQVALAVEQPAAIILGDFTAA